MKKVICLVLALVMAYSVLVLCACNNYPDEYTADGKLILNLRNLYFTDWTGGDAYTRYIEDKFNVAINPTSYSWADWDQQVYGPVNANNTGDVFHFNLDSYNYANSYARWIRGGDIKALPKDMSNWPNLKKMLDNTSNLESLMVDGELYCLPIAKNVARAETEYSPFTYVYRRDWAKELGVYQEGDVYTWDQFQNLLNVFYNAKCTSGDFVALADVEWGFPSIVNFFKDAPHCFAMEDGKVVSTYTTEKYIAGMNKAKSWVDNKYYGYDQYAAKDGDVAKKYYAGRIGVFYENLSLANYTTLRENVAKSPAIQTVEQLDDATAILKVSGPDGKYALEGTENWFSATFFSADISEEKMNKLLDMMDWLLSDEGTEMAAYGFLNYDYEKDADGNITLLEAGWEKDADGNYINKLNGAKFLRYMCTLCYDMNGYDPLVDAHALQILNNWQTFMNAQLAEGNLRILTEDGSVKWLNTTKKTENAGSLLTNAGATVVSYVYGKITMENYIAHFNSDTWTGTLAEINNYLGN